MWDGLSTRLIQRSYTSGALPSVQLSSELRIRSWGEGNRGVEQRRRKEIPHVSKSRIHIASKLLISGFFQISCWKNRSYWRRNQNIIGFCKSRQGFYNLYPHLNFQIKSQQGIFLNTSLATILSNVKKLFSHFSMQYKIYLVHSQNFHSKT